MKKQQFISLVLILTFMVGIYFFLKNSVKSPINSVVSGEALIGEFDAKKLTEIVIEGAGEKTELTKGAKGWQVKNRYDFAADPETVAEFIDNISTYKIFQKIEATPEDLIRFGLDKEKSTSLFSVKLLGEAKTVLSEFTVGLPFIVQSKAIGRYVYLPSSQEVLIVDNDMGRVASSPRLWLKKFIPGVFSLASVSGYRDNQLIWQVSRPGDQKPFRIRYPAHLQNTDLGEVKRVMDYIRKYHYLDVVETTEEFAPHDKLLSEHLVFESFDGTQFKIDFLGVQGQQLRSSIEVTQLSQEKKQFGWNNFELQQTLSEYHFLSSAQIYAVLRYFEKPTK